MFKLDERSPKPATILTVVVGGKDVGTVESSELPGNPFHACIKVPLGGKIWQTHVLIQGWGQTPAEAVMAAVNDGIAKAELDLQACKRFAEEVCH